MNLHSICHWRHSLGSDGNDHFFWSEYRVNRTRFHSLSSEFSLYWSCNRVKFTPQRMKFLHSIDGVKYSLVFVFLEYTSIVTWLWHSNKIFVATEWRDLLLWISPCISNSLWILWGHIINIFKQEKLSERRSISVLLSSLPSQKQDALW